MVPFQCPVGRMSPEDMAGSGENDASRKREELVAAWELSIVNTCRKGILQMLLPSSSFARAAGQIARFFMLLQIWKRMRNSNW